MSDSPSPEPTALARLAKEPGEFALDAAARILTHQAGVPDLAEAVRFVSRPGLGFAASDVLAVEGEEGEPPQVTLGLLGLTGVAGVLPRRYSEDAASGSGRALRALIDMLAHWMLADLCHAGGKYRLDRAMETARLRTREEQRRRAGVDGPADPGEAAISGPARDGHRAPHVEVLLAIAGFAEPDAIARLPFAPETVLHYAGLFALRPRSAERLAALASDWLGRRVEVVEFTGAWLRIDPAQRSRLPVGRDEGAFCTLGRDAALGTRAWDSQARVVLRIGPLDRAGFEALLPGRPALAEFVGMIRAYLGFEVGFAVNPVLAREDVPRLELAPKAEPGPLLGWNTWLGRGKGRAAPADVDEARFAAETVERREVG